MIELTEVYRQKGDSAILANAHRILEGQAVEEAPDFRILRGGTINHTQAKLATSLGMTFPKWAAAGEYDPIQDIILSPWNKRDLGTDNMNKWIAQFLGSQRMATVHQVIAGVTVMYLAEGDKVMFNKQVGVITRIAINGRYMGRAPLPASVNLNRFGTYTGQEEETAEDLDAIDYSHLNLDKMLEDEEGDRTKEASHIVDILLDDGTPVTLQATGDYSPSSFSLAYALTVHKAQGCEWRKVYFIMHRDHAVLREALSLLYRGALSVLVHRDHVPLAEGHTDGDCVRAARQALPHAAGDYFARLVQSWTAAAYAGRLPDVPGAEALCREWAPHFARPAEGAAA